MIQAQWATCMGLLNNVWLSGSPRVHLTPVPWLKGTLQVIQLILPPHKDHLHCPYLNGASVDTADKCQDLLKTYVTKKRHCVTLSQRFYKLCLDPDILQVCILNRADTGIRNDPNENSTRKAACRQFILDKCGYLGNGNRKVVPSCAVWKVKGR